MISCPGKPSPFMRGFRLLICSGTANLAGCQWYDWHADGPAPTFVDGPDGIKTCPEYAPREYPLIFRPHLQKAQK